MYLTQRSGLMEPDAGKSEAETTSGERIQTIIAGMESRRAEGICWWQADSMEELVFLQRGTQKEAQDQGHRYMIWKPEKGSTKGLRGGEDQPIPRDTVP